MKDIPELLGLKKKIRARSVSETFFMKDIPELLGFKEELSVLAPLC